VPNFNMIVPFLTSLGCPEVLTQNRNKQTQKKTDENEMPFPLYILLSCETMKHHPLRSRRWQKRYAF